MEDFVYIILAIVWLVISILGGKKKKKSQASTPKPFSEPQPIETDAQPASEKKSDFEDLLEDFFGTDKSSKPKQEPEPEVVLENRQERTFGQEKRDKGGSIQNAPWTYISEEKKKEFEGEVDDEFEFSAEGKVETLEDLIKSYERSARKTEEEDAKISVVDLDDMGRSISGLDFDARKAIIYAEIINRKHFR